MQQLCRWLLGRFDRLATTSELLVSQETIALTLGTRRAAISEAASNLKNNHIISYRRGKISLLNRAEIEMRSCQCYAIIKNQYERLIGGIQ